MNMMRNARIMKSLVCMFFVPIFCGAKNIIDTTGLEKFKQKEKFQFVSPLIGFNDNDGFSLGAVYMNTAYLGKTNWQYMVAPLYGFESKNVVGQAWFSYTTNNQSLTFRIGTKSYHKNTNSDFNYAERYTRFDPSTTYHFGTSEKPRDLELKLYVISEEDATFSAGMFAGKTNTTYYIPRLEYRSQMLSKPKDVFLKAEIEAQYYNNISPESYIKATLSYQSRWEYKPKKSFYLRFFGSGFLHNTQRRSTSYQNIFTRGSISLIQQGYNDYAYDEHFASRENQFGYYDKQVSTRNGGGFKTAIGNRFAYGMSNNIAFAINTSIDAPMKWLPIAPYFDFGVFAVPNGDGWKYRNMFNGGLSIKWIDIFAIHIPIVYSSELKDIHKSQNGPFFTRISFTLDLHQAEWWKRSFKYRNS